ncbi:MAG TPA: hypothetical protein VFT10_01425, partial [Solirubrobacterales bacterium]|nr:hypothetical protein [Solirubrobacterales bacterium]
DALRVRPGAVVTVGFWLSNSGPGKVGEVEARVDLPDRADSALELELEVTWSGNAGREKTTDAATIFVSPSESRACARYVPQSTREREGDGPRRASTLDWITSESGAFLDQFGSSLSEIRFVYFNVVVI